METVSEKGGEEITQMIYKLDHIVLTVGDIERTVSFYTNILGMEARTSKEGRHSLHFGDAKINLHEKGREFTPKAALPTPGSADLCFLSTVPVADIADCVSSRGIEIIEGPVERQGVAGPLTSIYFRDPDGNLIEVSNKAD